MDNKSKDINERRKYIRLGTVFPIEFQLLEKDSQLLSELREGFTRNVGKGGMGIFAKSLKESDREFFNFIPNETKIRLIINIPLDKRPIESFATVRWLEKQSSPLVDTYLFGVSYDVIDEAKYKKIMAYVKWLYVKPKLIFLTLVLLAIAFAFSIAFLFKLNARRIESEKRRIEFMAESKQAELARELAEKKRSEIEDMFKTAEEEKKEIQVTFNKLAEEKDALEKIYTESEEDKKELELELERLDKEKAILEEQVEKETAGGEEVEEATSTTKEKIPYERLKAEETNYNKFKELVLNEKIQSLSAYVSTHLSSIYHSAALFALAELRYKHGERALATVNYNQVIEFYPQSKYALYSSHRLEQLRRNLPYDHYTLKDIHAKYNLPALFDYRDIEPYVK